MHMVSSYEQKGEGFMEKTKELIKEERKFLRLCSQPYKDMIHKKREMPLRDFEVISYAIMVLDLLDYYMYFAGYLFKDLLDKEEILDKKFEEEWVLAKDMDYYGDWEVEKFKEMQRIFWEQMPLESQREKYREIFL